MVDGIAHSVLAIPEASQEVSLSMSVQSIQSDQSENAKRLLSNKDLLM